MISRDSINRRMLIVLAVWVAAMAVAAALDGPVARWSHWNAADKHHVGNHVMKMAGDVRFTLAVALALIAWHAAGWRAAGHLALSGLLGALVYSLCKWVVGRRRPVVGILPFDFEPFVEGFRGLGGVANLSFPSGHTTLAFATAACLAIQIPRWAWLFYAGAALVGIERVGENAHYLSDVVAGAGVGTLSAYIVFWWMQSVEAKRRAAESDPAILSEGRAAADAVADPRLPVGTSRFAAAVAADGATRLP